jgi:molybdenum cofactor guanylyltransferase
MGAIVLAGGRSRRMGRDKALLPWGETTLVEHIARTVRQVSTPVIVVAAETGQYVVPSAECVVGDRYPDTGPLGGLLTGLDHLEPGYHLLVGCDMPLLKPDLIRLLFSHAGGHSAAVPVVRGHLEPLCAVYSHSCQPALLSRLRSGDLSLQRAVEALGLQQVPEIILREADPDLISFTNLNTEEDYARHARAHPPE